MAGRRRNGVPIAMGSCFLYAAQIQEGLLYQVAMTMGRFKISLLLLALVCLPGTLLGNGLTPMMMGTSAHLLLGNILIGLLEGGLLKWRIGDKAYRPVVVMIGANYFSMLIGMFLCDSQSARLHSNLLYFQACFVLMVYLMWLVTLCCWNGLLSGLPWAGGCVVGEKPWGILSCCKASHISCLWAGICCAETIHC